MQVLVFVCVPLVLLLGFLIILLRHYNRRSVSFPSYSLTISNTGPTAAYLVYRSDEKVLEFVSEFRNRRKFFKPAIYVMIPTEIPNEDMSKILPNMVLGLDKLHYDYLIFRKTGSQRIQVRDAAVTELGRMGAELQSSTDDGQVSRAVISKIDNRGDGQASATISRVQTLMRQVAGAADNIEVLACSDRALRPADLEI